MHIPKAVDAKVKMELVRKPSFNSFCNFFLLYVVIYMILIKLKLVLRNLCGRVGDVTFFQSLNKRYLKNNFQYPKILYFTPYLLCTAAMATIYFYDCLCERYNIFFKFAGS